jgi:polyhydroxybutyrate depolymerase
MIIAITIIGLLALTGLFLFFYWAYAPIPKVPKLVSDILKSEMTIETEKRTYWKYIPKPSRKGKMPLVIVLHGSGINGAKIRAWTGYEFDQMADEFDFAVAYPDGYKNNWNDIRKTAPFPAKEKNINDVGFIKSLIETFRLAYDIDPRQVYVFGYSNGGMMAFRLAISEPGLLAGIATIGSNLPAPDEMLINIQGLMPPVLMVNGTADPIIPYEGGRVNFFGKQLGNVISTDATAEALAASHPGGKTMESLQIPHLNANDATSAERKIWLQDGRKLVALYTVHKGGHVIPHPLTKFPRLMGKVNRDFNTPREAVRFWGFTKS